MRWPLHRKYPEHRLEEVDSHEYDYVIVGGGTSGCALASRLSEDPNISVLVLERGPLNDTWTSRIPLVSSNILDPEIGARHWIGEPMKYCDNRESLFFRGEVMGGGSRINGMVYTRGAVEDYDAWAALGHKEWSYDKVLPYFVSGETAFNRPKSSYRGDSGPWITRSFTYRDWPFRAYWIFTDCAEAMGFPRIPDVNAPNIPADGLATLDSTVDQDNRRVSSFDAFLPRKLARQREKHLTICTKALVSRIVFSNEEVPQVREVLLKSVDSKSDKVFTARVKNEVIVCSGAIGSPQVLMLSGIGPREHLKERGIDVVYDLPGVGSELSDHHGIPVAWEVPVKESLAAVVTSPITRGAIEFFKYIMFGTGLLSIPILTLSLFVRSSSLRKDGTELIVVTSSQCVQNNNSSSSLSRNNTPDIELMPLSTSSMDDLKEHHRLFSKIGVFSLLATLLHPKSRGSVRLSSANPHDNPKVDFGILSNPEDYIVSRTAVRLSLKLGKSMKGKGFPILGNLTFSKERQEKDIKEMSNEEIDKFIRKRIRSTYHYAGSCRMAPEHEKAPGVVDDKLRVYGVKGLRVCDTSIFPQIISAHLQASAVMVAERCADWIKKTL